MPKLARLVFILALVGLARCGNSGSGIGPQLVDGHTHYDGNNEIACDRPLLLEGSRERIYVTGACRLVMVEGDHNDVFVGIAPGGKVVVIGGHNDIWWHSVRPGTRTDLVNAGPENDFHEQSE